MFQLHSFYLYFLLLLLFLFFFFFFNDTSTTEIYTLSLYDALPIWICACISRATESGERRSSSLELSSPFAMIGKASMEQDERRRSEEHTSELQSRGHLVCRLLLEKKKKKLNNIEIIKRTK